jgi:hypothetical protein
MSFFDIPHFGRAGWTLLSRAAFFHDAALRSASASVPFLSF